MGQPQRTVVGDTTCFLGQNTILPSSSVNSESRKTTHRFSDIPTGKRWKLTTMHGGRGGKDTLYVENLS